MCSAAFNNAPIELEVPPGIPHSVSGPRCSGLSSDALWTGNCLFLDPVHGRSLESRSFCTQGVAFFARSNVPGKSATIGISLAKCDFLWRGRVVRTKRLRQSRPLTNYEGVDAPQQSYQHPFHPGIYSTESPQRSVRPTPLCLRRCCSFSGVATSLWQRHSYPPG